MRFQIALINFEVVYERSIRLQVFFKCIFDDLFFSPEKWYFWGKLNHILSIKDIIKHTILKVLITRKDQHKLDAMLISSGKLMTG